jgi:hypothetical protein
MTALARYLFALLVLVLCTVSSSAQASSPQSAPATTPLQSLIQALSGKWHLEVHFEPGSSTGNKAVEGTGEESWSAGPGGITLIEREHIPLPPGSAFLMGVIWWDRAKKQLGGMECNSYLPGTCDLKGGLNDITITWDERKFEIDEVETHDGKRTVWHEAWTNITNRSFVQTGDVTEPDGTTKRYMTVRGMRVKKLKTIGGE